MLDAIQPCAAKLILVSWSCRIHRLRVCGRIRLPPTTSALDMTVKRVKARLQSWISVEY